MIVRRTDTPIGELWLGEEGGKICRVSRELPPTCSEGNSPLLALAEQQIAEYFAGKRTEFELPLGITAEGFAGRVYEKLVRVPFGETISYKQLAEAAGSPRAARAVGNVCGANPLILLVPCHRVICSDGSLGGFALGVDIKSRLLEHEVVILNEKK